MITARVVADSISPSGKRITSFELDYPRFIHSEFLTHRMLSKNAASSRAIPVSVTIGAIQDNPAMPVYWGKNQSGMSAKEELSLDEIDACKAIWIAARDHAIGHAQDLIRIGLHKQIANRILEPWVHIKVVVTATEWDNFFFLRRHPDAQPEIHALADAMWEARQLSVPVPLGFGEWHLPYIPHDFSLSEEDYAEILGADPTWSERLESLADNLKDTAAADITSGAASVDARDRFLAAHRQQILTDVKLKLSASLCAQTSYRKSDESITKALNLYDRLVNQKPVHASPFEHQATPAEEEDERSGNFTGWIQHRQQIPGNVCRDYSDALA